MHPLVKFEMSLANQNIFFNQDCNLNIFEHIASTSEPTKEFVNKELLIFKQYQVNVKNMKYPFQRWEKHQLVLLTIGFLACQILNIIGSHFFP